MRSLIALLMFALPAPAQSPAPLSSEDVRAWRADLAFLRAEAPARHANLYHTMTRAQFDSALSSIDARLPQFARHQVIVELEKLAALVGDGHSNVGPWRDSVIAFHSLPVALYSFTEGLLVRSADSAHTGLIGSRVVAIGNVPINDAVNRAKLLVSRDNDMAYEVYVPFLLAMPEVLHALGLSSSPASATFILEKDGKRSTTELWAAGLFPMFTGDADKQWLPRTGWRDARDAAPPPLWLSDPANIYWFRYLPTEQTLYAQINTIQQKQGDSLGVFIARAIGTADSAGAKRLVLDLRLNSGGNGGFNKAIILPLIKSRYDAPDRLYVITGRRTFSAAQMLVTDLGKWTRATFVGEPTSSKGNHFGDSYRIVLPNSRVTFRVSTLWHQYLDSRDTRTMINPQLPVRLAFEDYIAGRDPALQAIHKVR